MTTGPTTVTSAAADTTKTAAVAPSVDAVAAQTRADATVTPAAGAVAKEGQTAGATSPQAIPTKPTLTIAGLCDLLRELGDGEVDGASLITPLALCIKWSPKGHTQDYTRGPAVATRSFAPSNLKGYNTISLSGIPVPAADLLKAVEPCLPTHADARVCVRLRRATTDRPRAVALSTDDVLFKDDPHTAAEAKATAEVIDFVKSMVEMRTIEPAKIAAAASALMPAGWSATCYCVDGVLFHGWFELQARLPRLYVDDTTSLFATFTNKPSDAGVAKHGRFDLVASIPGITFAAFDEAFGPKKNGGCKIARLLATAAAASGSTSASSP